MERLEEKCGEKRKYFIPSPPLALQGSSRSFLSRYKNEPKKSRLQWLLGLKLAIPGTSAAISSSVGASLMFGRVCCA